MMCRRPAGELTFRSDILNMLDRYKAQLDAGDKHFDGGDMTDKKERELAFRLELEQLLDKHKAELGVSRSYEDYGYSSKCDIEVTMYTILDDDSELISEYQEFVL